VSQTVRRKGLGGPRIGEISKRLFMSGIIYGIPECRVGIDINGLMHMRNNQLGKVVSP
jgi:hypothetical protein